MSEQKEKELSVKKNTEKEDNYFVTLNNIDVSKKVEKKNGLNYLSWAWAWAELKKIHPKANYKIYETVDGCFYWTDGKTCWVKTSVTVEELEHIEYLPIMDYKNKSIPLADVTSFNVNTSIQRSLTKAAARHGVGLYIYAGEDLPEQLTENKEKEEQKDEPTEEQKKPQSDEITPKQLKWLETVFGSEQGKKLLPTWLQVYRVDTLSKLTAGQAKDMIDSIRQQQAEKQNAK